MPLELLHLHVSLPDLVRTLCSDLDKRRLCLRQLLSKHASGAFRGVKGALRGACLGAGYVNVAAEGGIGGLQASELSGLR